MLNPPYDKYSRHIGIYHVVLNKQEKFSACAESSLNKTYKN
jgi:CMP-2-keto-3-deoxyoctulosonic acid synthetase